MHTYVGTMYSAKTMSSAMNCVFICHCKKRHQFKCHLIERLHFKCFCVLYSRSHCKLYASFNKRLHIFLRIKLKQMSSNKVLHYCELQSQISYLKWMIHIAHQWILFLSSRNKSHCNRSKSPFTELLTKLHWNCSNAHFQVPCPI